MKMALQFGRFSSLTALLVAGALAGLSGCGAGEKGDPGPAGANGINGADGTQGMQGPTGDKGDPGASVAVDQSLSPIEKAFVALGGKDALTAMTSVEIQSDGVRWMLGEGFAPEDPAGKVSTFNLVLKADMAADNMRLDYKRHIEVLGITADTTFSEILKGNVAALTGAEHIFGYPGGDLLSDRWASIRKQQMILNPHSLLQMAANDPSMVLDDTGVGLLDGSIHHLLVLSNPTSPITLWVNKATGWLDKMTFTENEPLHRDVEIEVFYYGWEAAQGSALRFPKEAYIAMDGNIIHAEARSMATVNPMIDPAQFDLPMGSMAQYVEEDAKRGAANHQYHQLFCSIGIPLDGQQTYVDPVEIKPGVWHLKGGSHNSLVVDQAAGLVLVDAPLDEGRQNAVLAWTGTQFPGKPIKYVILTHHHSDHVGGVRTIAAAGANVIVSAHSVAYIRDALNAPSTVYPDALAMNPKLVTVQTVSDMGSMVLSDATRPVGAYHIPTNHAADMLIVHVPVGNSDVVFNSDLLNAGPNLFIPPPFIPNGTSLYNALLAHNWNGPNVVLAGGHGAGTNTFGELKTALGL